MKRLLFASLALAMAADTVNAAPPLTDHTAAAAIIGEAANQSDRCMVAIAAAIRLRGSLQGIYGVNNPVVKHAGPNLWARAARAWRASASPSAAHASAGCRYFGCPTDAPYFRHCHYKPVLTLGAITFYEFFPNPNRKDRMK